MLAPLMLTDTRKNKWTQDNNITSIIAYTYKNNEREREWQNANEVWTYLYTDTTGNTYSPTHAYLTNR